MPAFGPRRDRAPGCSNSLPWRADPAVRQSASRRRPLLGNAVTSASSDGLGSGTSLASTQRTRIIDSRLDGAMKVATIVKGRSAGPTRQLGQAIRHCLAEGTTWAPLRLRWPGIVLDASRCTGPVDVLARHPHAGYLLVVEVKSVVPDSPGVVARIGSQGPSGARDREDARLASRRGRTLAGGRGLDHLPTTDRGARRHVLDDAPEPRMGGPPLVARAGRRHGWHPVSPIRP